MRIAIILCLLLTLNGFAQQANSDFVFTINTQNTGTSSNAYSLHVDAVNHTYNFDVDWQNDGIFDNTYTNASVTSPNTSVSHVYPNSGVHTIRIRGNYPKLYFRNDVNITSVDQWGDIVWLDVADAFRDCINLTTSPIDTPNLTQITSLANMFYGASNFNGPVNHWDVSNVQYFTYVFGEATSFNQPINDWDMSNATQILGMFTKARSFNQNISGWNTANVQLAMAVLYNANSFNQDLSNWDISSIGTHGLVQAFDSTAIKPATYDLMLHAWSQGNSGVPKSIGVSGLTYCDTVSRNALLQSGWVLMSDSQGSNCSAIVGITENTSPTDLLDVYPNPTKGLIKLYSATETEAELYDLTGRLIERFRLNKGENIKDLSDLKSGLYLIQTENVTRKIFKD